MDEVDAEVRGSVGDLRGLGLGPVHYFAYPYGEVDERVEGVVRTSGITAAFAIDPGVMDDSTDHLRIPRVEIVRADRTLRFLAKVAFARQLAHTHRLSRKGRSLAGRLRRRSIGSSVGGRRGSG
jgi:hypothetical protein